MKTLAIIPARGGSKRIPKKNIKLFNGNPIISYSITTALNSNIFDEVMVSTDSEKIAQISKDYGAKIPFMRSKKNSSDYATTMDVIEEVLLEYESIGKKFDYFCCIYPTAPFINVEILKKAFENLINESVGCVLPVSEYTYPPQRSLVIDNNYIKMLNPENYNMRSQDLKPIYHDAGQFYFMETKVAMKEKKLYPKKTMPIIISNLECQDIDNIVDWKLAEIKYDCIKAKK